MIKARSVTYDGTEYLVDNLTKYPRNIDSQWKSEIRYYPGLQQIYNFVVYRHFIENRLLKGKSRGKL